MGRTELGYLLRGAFRDVDAAAWRVGDQGGCWGDDFRRSVSWRDRVEPSKVDHEAISDLPQLSVFVLGEPEM